MPTPPRRRWFRYSLRALFVVLSLLCVAFGVALHHFRTRRAAIAAIDELGGSYGVQTQGPTWLRKLVKDDKYFYDVRRVAFGPSTQDYKPDRPFTDEELGRVVPYLNYFRQFRNFNLTNCDITDNGMRFLSGFRDLEILRLGYTPVTDAGLSGLERLSSLKELDLSGTKVTKKGIANLQRSLPNCKIDHDPFP